MTKPRDLTPDERAEAIDLVREYGIAITYTGGTGQVLFGSWIDFEATGRERFLIGKLFRHFPQDAYMAAVEGARSRRHR